MNKICKHMPRVEGGWSAFCSLYLKFMNIKYRKVQTPHLQHQPCRAEVTWRRNFYPIPLFLCPPSMTTCGLSPFLLHSELLSLSLSPWCQGCTVKPCRYPSRRNTDGCKKHNGKVRNGPRGLHKKEQQSAPDIYSFLCFFFFNFLSFFCFSPAALINMHGK